MKIINICITGAYGEKNFGDDILMISFVNWIRMVRPDSRVSIFTRAEGHAYISRLVNDVDVFSSESINNREFDLEILGGGTHYFSFKYYDSTIFSYIYFLKEKLSYKISSLVKDKFIKPKYNISAAKKIAVGVGFGPFELYPLKSKIRELFPFDIIATRDSLSSDALSLEGINAIHGADICFNEKYWMKPSSRRAEKSNSVHHIKIILRDWKHKVSGEDYVDEIILALNSFKNTKIIVSFVFFSKGGDIVCKDKLDSAGIGYTSWNPDANSVEEFVLVLKEADLIVSARYHGLVTSMAMNVPCIGIEVEPKIRSLSIDSKEAIPVWPVDGGARDFVDLIESSLVKIKKMKEEQFVQSSKLSATVQVMLGEVYNRCL